MACEILECTGCQTSKGMETHNASMNLYTYIMIPNACKYFFIDAEIFYDGDCGTVLHLAICFGSAPVLCHLYRLVLTLTESFYFLGP